MAGPKDEQPLDLQGVPGEEDVSKADAADRVDVDPEQERNFTETHPEKAGDPPRDSAS
jgi:hypothetical protein